MYNYPILFTVLASAYIGLQFVLGNLGVQLPYPGMNELFVQIDMITGYVVSNIIPILTYCWSYVVYQI